MLAERYGERIRCFTPAPMLDTFTLRYEHVNEQSVYKKKLYKILQWIIWTRQRKLVRNEHSSFLS